ncbi:C2H2-type domain-containing protein [Meloidogyne graminicola]|uniref:C2H2-type domain-containing protein n=1 Tax=Meloidogyne graminicola TaxID=189291 RepID=A0A8T0A085_9BILA|nr:C2H2-type domain-containing protein [Meloidogyne graminicola]
MTSSPYSYSIDNPLIVISGCTGTGKSDLGVAIAKEFNGEIINADSMQIYKGLDISSNKISTEEMEGIPHHLLGFLEPTNSNYNVQNFRNDALNILNKIWSEQKLPILVGGTAYYIESVIFDNNLIATGDREKGDLIRQELLNEFPTVDLLYQELQRVDPVTAAELHRNNKHRVLRALEIYRSTGKTKSEHEKLQKLEAPGFDHFYTRLRFKNTFLINLDMEKDVLNERLNKRVDKMMERGLLKEVADFYDQWFGKVDKFGIMQIIGPKEFLPYLRLNSVERNCCRGDDILDKCKEKLKIRNRQYSQRQRLWFYNRILNRGQYREIPKSLALNSSKDFHGKLVPFAIKQVKQFLSGEEIDDEKTCNGLLYKLPPLGEGFKQPDYMENRKKIFLCDICGTEVQGKIHWKQHLEGRKHKNNLEKSKNRIEIKG